jgi:hypothetical protein
MCEESSGCVSQPQKRRQKMQRIVRNAIGFAVALGTSGLMFAVTLA